MKFKTVLVFLLFCGSVRAQNVNIIPQPKSVINGTGQFTFSNHSTVGVNDASLLPIARYFQKQVSQSAGFTLAVDNKDAGSVIHLLLTNGDPTAGAYSLKIVANEITISSSNRDGVFYGMISLLQMIKDQPRGESINLSSLTITDTPRYQWRGLMLDESRHFFGMEKVKQILDWMAYYKLNKFHWHLTDAQGWRLEIKKYPKLTLVGGIGNYSDSSADPQYYTQAQIKDIIAYAAERFITVIPEIDMPGHATAANKAYPQFSGGSVEGYPNFTFNPAIDSTYQFLGNIIKETSALFPSKMIHLGGDEVALGVKAWSLNPSIAGFMQKNNFADVGELERYFFKRVADTALNAGNKILAWDEATGTNLPADKTIIFWWRQNLPGQLHLAVQKGYQVVLCPRLPMYFDFVQDADHISGRRWKGVYNTVGSVYGFPERQLQNNEDLQSKQIIGVQANIWTEMIGSEKRLDFMLFPRIAGLAEAGWTAPELKDEEAFNNRLKASIKIYDAASIYYFNPFDKFFHDEAIDFGPKIRKMERPPDQNIDEEGYRPHRRHGRASKRSSHSSKHSSSVKHSSSKKSSSKKSSSSGKSKKASHKKRK
ncbi:beta-N-acetylhexosaminidase [Mucilaginibacter sp. SMC90]|uniref:beta-N-acetylhexosaminidase n=1 Tax=Mucilaginibacter sp. SMC90 TaxID=2929803 RepID=UPI001FB54CD8|nr:beta-N-acetylhexosaminidase [Mucilaginibacter sp. SMC90]UOE51774.1 beta-N-acetylhexosaminidase [Mucilaginibacter sp. SMC90]